MTQKGRCQTARRNRGEGEGEPVFRKLISEPDSSKRVLVIQEEESRARRSDPGAGSYLRLGQFTLIN